jgi:protein CpxP
LQLQRQVDSQLLPGPAVMPGAGTGMLSGKWWNRPVLAARIGLTADQQKKMDEIYQQARLQMIDLSAALQKEQAMLEPMIAVEQPDETAIDAQIDRAGKARAEVEKANTGMLLAIRRVLLPEQWAKLKSERD